MKSRLIFLGFFLVLFLVGTNVGAFVVDHTNVNQFDSLTQEQTDRVRDMSWLFGHQSTGSYILHGVYYTSLIDSKYSMDFGPRPDPWEDWTADVTRQSYINDPTIMGSLAISPSNYWEMFQFWDANYDLVDVGMMKFCYNDFYDWNYMYAEDAFNDYKAQVDAFRVAHPDAIVIHVTTAIQPLQDENSYQRWRFSEMMRAEYSDEYLIDLSDLESWRNGAYTTFDYNGNTVQIMDPTYTNDGGHPTSYEIMLTLGKAWWVMLARVAEDLAAPSNPEPSCPVSGVNRCWYVDQNNPSCSDSGSGNWTIPFCTINAANTNHNGGDHVYILPGEYRESLYPKSGTGENTRTIYSGWGDKSQIKVLGSNDLSGGWTQCTVSDPNCVGVSTNVWYKNWESTARRIVFYRIDGGPLPPCSSYWIDSGFYSCSSGNTPTKYDTDCWEDRQDWYLRSDLELVGNPRLTTTRDETNINSPGMFYYKHDLITPSNSILYVWPHDSGNANSHEIECSQRRVAGWSGFDLPSYGPLNYVTLQNVTIMHSLVNGINLHAGTEYLTVQDCEFAFNSGQGTAGENPSAILKNTASSVLQKGLKILRNEIHDQGSDKGPGLRYADWHSGLGATLYATNNTLFEGNHMYNLAEGVFVKSGDVGIYKNINTTFRNNVFHDIRYHAISYGTGTAGIFGGVVEGNIIYNIYDTSWVGGGIDIRGPFSNISVRGNTIYNVTSRGIGVGIQGAPPLDNMRIQNNIVLDVNDYSVDEDAFLSYYWGSTSSIVSDYNLLFDTNDFFGVVGAGHMENVVLAYNNLSSWRSGTGLDFHSLEADPMFVDPANGNFSLQAGSPAIDAGTIIPGYHCEQAGVETFPGCRIWYGNAPDIGAIESNSGGVALSYDVNSDGSINIIDLALATYWQGKNVNTEPRYSHLDLNKDGVVNWQDVWQIIIRI